ncbi:MAG: S9 family peptidase [Burkholderiaceae bacterium]|nr:S9 family peptidase [Burkholderiaceae bacterium]
MPLVSRLLAALTLLCVPLFSANVSAAPVPIETFFENATMSGATMSPDGHFVAIRLASKANDGRAVLAVLDLETMTPKPVASFDGYDVGMFHWVNDKRLVFNLTDLRIPPGDWANSLAPGLFAVNRDGSDFRRLVARDYRYLKLGGDDEQVLPWNTFFAGTTAEQDSNDVFVEKVEGYGKHVDTYSELERLNTVTGRIKVLDIPIYSTKWLVDREGVPRIAQSHRGKMVELRYNDPATGQWRKFAEFEELSDNAFWPLHYAEDGTLYVQSANGKDKTTVYRYDLAHNALLPEPVAYSENFDIFPTLILNHGKLLGMRYQLDGEITQWFDADMAALQKEVDVRLQTTTNRLEPPRRPETPYIVIEAFSDVQPSIFLLYNRETKKLVKLGSSHPAVDPKQMGHKDIVRYQARDGLIVPAYITMPRGPAGKNLPMVVLVHGGPFVRGGYWRWNPEAEFLASRGYVVLEPEFRGSEGFGSKHFKAGWKQWGLAMQDDVADGVKWAIAQGIADPKRICIGGASYGGYATLMGLINDPDLYRCGFEWVGVTDIDLMYSVSWSDFSDSWKQYGMPIIIGDREKDAAQLKATSPIEQAARIKQPLLMAYGGVDERVPKIHGEKFYDSVRKTNSDVEWIVYPEEGHGWKLVEDKVDFWSHVEKFLARNIGAPTVVDSTAGAMVTGRP